MIGQLVDALRLCRTLPIVGLILIAFASGCATGPKIEWNERIGNYTYDQAILEMGPPDRMASLTDGTKVAEWLTGRGSAQGLTMGWGGPVYPPYGYGPTTYYHAEPPTPDRFLRLTFGPDGRLLRWQRVYR